VSRVSWSTQRDQLLALFVPDREVPLPEILALGIVQYNARIFELRRLGFRIKNRTQEINGVKHSWFRLVQKPEQPAGSAQPDRTAKARQWLSVARGETTQASETRSLFGDHAPDRSYRE
jgi:hypothetical protein